MPMFSEVCQKKLDGKVVAITGANTGIGKETALDLSKRGAKVLILCRDTTKAETAAEDIRKVSGNVVDVIKLDLASLKSVRECAEAISEKESKIDILINNAGVMICPGDWKTEDGFDMQFGTNHLGHFLLTELLLPLLKASKETGFHPRIINVSSSAHQMGRINFEDLNWEKTSYEPWKAYGQSKLANILHAKGLADKLEGSGISAYSLHPGVVNTELQRHAATSWIFKVAYPLMKPFMKTPLSGAQTTLYCALEDSIEDKTGLYFSGCAETTPTAAARNEETRKKLWEISEKLVGLKPNTE